MTNHGLLVLWDYQGKGGNPNPRQGDQEREFLEPRQTQATRGRGGYRGRGGRGGQGGRDGSVRGRTFTRGNPDTRVISTDRNLPKAPPQPRAPLNPAGPSRPIHTDQAKNAPPSAQNNMNTNKEGTRPKNKTNIDSGRQFEPVPPLNAKISTKEKRVMKQINRNRNMPNLTMEVTVPSPVPVPSPVSVPSPVTVPVADATFVLPSENTMGAGVSTPGPSAPVHSYSIFQKPIYMSTPETPRYMNNENYPPQPNYQYGDYQTQPEQYEERYQPTQFDLQPRNNTYDSFQIPSQNQVQAWETQRRQSWMHQMMSATVSPDMIY